MPITPRTFLQPASLHRALLGRVLVALAVLLPLGTAWAGAFTDRAERVFSSTIIASVKESGAAGEVTFKVPERAANYFVTGDKLNKVFAIDSARIFRDVEGLERLTFHIPAHGKTYSLRVTRADIEKHYGMSFKGMSMDAWRNEFIQVFDNKQSRAKFVERFVKAE